MNSTLFFFLISPRFLISVLLINFYIMEKRKIVCVYHRVDFDGVFSALLVNHYRGEHEIVNIGWNYGDSMPDLGEYDELYLVDISFPSEVMINLPKDKVVWIDHHRTALNSAKEFGYSDIPGLRREGTAGCELTYEYFTGSQDDMPSVIRLLGRYDVWDKSGYYDWDSEILPFQYGLRQEFGLKLEEILPHFFYLLNDESCIPDLIDLGYNILKYQQGKWESQVKNHAFPVTVAGKYKGIAMLTPEGGSMMFRSVMDEYDIYIPFNRRLNDKGEQIYTLSMYAEAGRIDLALGDYVKSFGLGGGGHPCACGTEITEEQFINLIVNHVI